MTNSVGQRTNEAKKAAEEPASAFSKLFKSFVSFLRVTFRRAFWHKPYDMKRTAFSEMLAVNAGTVPAYKPR